MSKTPSGSGSAFDPKAWIIPGVVTSVLAAAVVTYPRAAEIHAAAGSPYYPKAAAEALAGLRSPDEKQAVAAVPALPAGLSADEHYWCEQCKTYHKRQPAGQAAVGSAPPAAAVNPPAAAGTDAIPPLPPGYAAADYYWCVNCKVYHSRANPKLSVPGVVDATKATPPAQPAVIPVPPGLVPPATPSR